MSVSEKNNDLLQEKYYDQLYYFKCLIESCGKSPCSKTMVCNPKMNFIFFENNDEMRQFSNIINNMYILISKNPFFKDFVQIFKSNMQDWTKEVEVCESISQKRLIFLSNKEIRGLSEGQIEYLAKQAKRAYLQLKPLKNAYEHSPEKNEAVSTFVKNTKDFAKRILAEVAYKKI